MDSFYDSRELAELGLKYYGTNILISEFSTYKGLESARLENLFVAHKTANQVICLPMHHELSEDDTTRVINCIIG